ncbi:helix-turn-helix domain-containing protein [Mesobacillus subterraneus]|uniref:helix-turn-helix domain-containing protein n=1 Tax=Mesobacillus subterraneus TaxID=285983 RepID=UPI002040127D|nr:helix-turn-helix transcriptional regulator [Mesobacillus subterraneus]MCM3665848.1 helix-turn-helix domain-containing protein [Mesobacillus subterraneus]MCM3684761.1 helix-turn-helix domain-containing protein [Mesobacillus subterraneus]
MEEKLTILIGEPLRKLRKQKLQSQEDLADYSKLNRKYISNLERNLQSPTLETIIKLAIALDIKPSEFIKEIEKYEANAQYLLEASKEVEEIKAVYSQNKNNSKND